MPDETMRLPAYYSVEKFPLAADKIDAMTDALSPREPILMTGRKAPRKPCTSFSGARFLNADAMMLLRKRLPMMSLYAPLILFASHMTFPIDFLICI